MSQRIDVIAFDADDTLWINEPIFVKTQDRVKEILSHHMEIKQLDDLLYQTEVKNLRLFGYGVKGFTLSMIETVIELTKEAVTGPEIQSIIDLGKEMLEHPVEVLEGVRETLEVLQKDHTLMIITKGDLFDQESKVARSGLAPYFSHVEVVSEKNKSTYDRILTRYDFNRARFMMVGNSLKSDVLPLVELGVEAVHIPYHTTWTHEKVASHIEAETDFHRLDDIRQLPRFLSH